MDPESGSARLRKERTGIALIMLTKKTRCRLAATAAIIALVSLGIAPSSAYAQHRGGGGGGFHGGGGGGFHGGGWRGGGWGGGWRGGGWGRGGWGWGWPVAAGLFA